MSKKLLVILMVLTLLVIPFLIACSSSNSTTTSTATSATTKTATATVTTTAVQTSVSTATTTVASAAKTLKVGLLAYYSWPIGLDMVYALQAWADYLNNNGGLKIGNDYYSIQFVTYDSNQNQATAEAAINRLIFEDKVKFIIADPALVDPWLPITEANKVLVVASTQTSIILDSSKNYCFEGGYQSALAPALIRWFTKNYPDKKTCVLAYPDNQMGHDSQVTTEAALKTYGLEPSAVFYPENSTDLSSMGLKIKSMNPDVFLGTGGSPSTDGQSIKAVIESGYTGMCISTSPFSAKLLTNFVPAESVEGFINIGWCTEYDPPLTDLAKQFIAAYTAKKGTWDAPEVSATSVWFCLQDALQQAGSIDVDKVADVLAGGLEFETPTGGECKMVARQDLNNSRTVDSIAEFYPKQIHNGLPVNIGHITLDESYQYFQETYFK